MIGYRPGLDKEELLYRVATYKGTQPGEHFKRKFRGLVHPIIVPMEQGQTNANNRMYSYTHTGVIISVNIIYAFKKGTIDSKLATRDIGEDFIDAVLVLDLQHGGKTWVNKICIEDKQEKMTIDEMLTSALPSLRRAGHLRVGKEFNGQTKVPPLQ